MLLEKFVVDQLNQYAVQIEEKFNSDVIYYYGHIHQGLINLFRDFIEQIPDKKPNICIFLKTGGGAVEPVEKMVDIIRHYYQNVWFFIPDFAMSAGTIFCLAGDKIYMDYSSSLGPIDPQVLIKENGVDQYVPALGVLEQVEKLIKKSREGTMTPAEFALLQNQNLAVLSSYEHARELSIDLATRWLAQYKFKDWGIHRTDPDKKGREVTQEEKKKRAEETVKKLMDHATWHSHSRYIGKKMLADMLRLEIDDYPDEQARLLIRSYSDLLTDHFEQKNRLCFMHNKLKVIEV